MLLTKVQMRMSPMVIKMEKHRCFQGLFSRVNGISLNLVFTFQSCPFLDGLACGHGISFSDALPPPLGVLLDSSLPLTPHI